MTEAKPAPKPRSSFVPVMLIVVGLVVCAGVVVVAFVPLVECGGCMGIGSLSKGDFEHMFPNPGPFYTEDSWECEWCEAEGRTTLWRKVADEPTPGVDLRGNANWGQFRASRREQHSTP